MPGQLHAPHHGVGLRIDHLDRRLAGLDLASEAGDDVVVVRRHVGVVDRMVDGDASITLWVAMSITSTTAASAPLARPEPRAGDLGRPRDDAGVDLPVLLVDDDLVGPLRQRDLLNELQRLRVEDVDGLVLLVGAVVIEAVGVNRQVVRVRTAPDEPDDPVDGRIDDVMDVAGVVALEDPHGDPS